MAADMEDGHAEVVEVSHGAPWAGVDDRRETHAVETSCAS